MMSDREFSELQRKVQICPGQCAWPKPDITFSILGDKAAAKGFEFELLTVLNARRKAMLKTSVLAAFLAVIALSPAYAAQDLCNDAHMKQMDDMIAKMTDATKKKEATTALDMSKAAMKKGDTAGCMKHMNEAHKAMGM
jgi:hypothetical protein